MRGYKVVMSTGAEIKIDPEEIKVVESGIAGNGIVKVKQGLINPSFIVSVIPDKDRADTHYGDDVLPMKPLDDLFPRVGELKSIGDVLKK